jgi:hypothetical protein
VTQRECLLAAAEYIETVGASLSDEDADEIVATLKRLAEGDYPTCLVRLSVTVEA